MCFRGTAETDSAFYDIAHFALAFVAILIILTSNAFVAGGCAAVAHVRLGIDADFFAAKVRLNVEKHKTITTGLAYAIETKAIGFERTVFEQAWIAFDDVCFSTVFVVGRNISFAGKGGFTCTFVDVHIVAAASIAV